MRITLIHAGGGTKPAEVVDFDKGRKLARVPKQGPDRVQRRSGELSKLHPRQTELFDE